jgi:hypothetical protein
MLLRCKYFFFILVILLATGSLIFVNASNTEHASQVISAVKQLSVVSPTRTPISTPLQDCFSSNLNIEELGGIPTNGTALWWLNSGGRAIGGNGVCKTIQGNLSANDPWRVLYAKNNPQDTDDGYHPQNLFRFVYLKSYKDYYQQMYFKINKLNLSSSPNRNQSNGVLTFNRYQDDDNLYYLGLRVDGYAVLKKKQNGTYYTLAQKQIYPGIYDRTSKPNLLPLNSWIGTKSELVNLNSTSVRIRFFVDKNNSSNWEQVFEFIDNTQVNSKEPILSPGYGGIRSDFMDVEFKNYKINGVSF